MCGRFVLIQFETFGLRFKVTMRGSEVTHIDIQSTFPDLNVARPRYNIAPTQPVLTILDHGRGREVEIMRWGFIPSWAREDKLPRNTFNARDDRLLESGMWRGSLRHKRCIIPADGYYEWKKTGDRSSIPHFIHPADGQTWAMAGIYYVWNSPDGSSIPSCAVITTDANESLSAIHDRMPAILTGDEFDAWLDPTVDDREALVSLLRPASPEKTDHYPVSKLVNNVANDSPGNIARSGMLL